ncbi:MAG TPA: FAD-binding protein [Vicinamibacterales bacterium]|jgi:FAD/FMN-containing dehydrogenase|nr:FAD-binding protein [Vicinamibacterales bacterium]
MAQINRRGFLKASSAAVAALPVAGCIAHPFPVRSPYASAIPSFEPGAVVNDIHSQLNATRVDRIVKPRTVEELRTAIASARSAGKPVSIAGGRHAMGGQQFAEAGFLVDTRGMNHVLAFDDERGVIVVEGGIQWPDLVEYLNTAQEGRERQWGIYQKQTGADRLSIAGALACNAHGRGLNLKPIVDQVQAFDLIGPDGGLRTCSRTENPKLFRLAIGGYGLFGAISRVELKLRPRVKVRRVVAIGETPTIIERFEARIRDGYQYGDYQFATDSNRESFLGRGVFSCYQPVPSDTPLTQNPTRFNPEDWANLTFYSHTHKKLAFDTYTRRYLATSGQIYWADWQLSAAYVDNYHADIDRATHAKAAATEMITEIYVKRPALAAFMHDARDMLRLRRANVIYGTVRMIEPDDETFLAWARDRYACVVLNLHVEHTPQAIDEAAESFRQLIDLGIKHGGSYYLTYHRWARKDQVEACYPQMREFLALKREYDPDEVFQSTWYRHYRDMFATE